MTSTQAVDRFERERSHLFTLAYGFLGSRAEAEDAVQDAWLRWQSIDADTVHEPAAWLTTVTARIALDRLRSARVKRETYPGVWLPEPIVDAPSPEAAVLTESGLTVAFLFLLERLSPEERAAFVLREVFDQPYRQIGEAIGKTEAACRQLIKRAREKMRSDHPPRAEVNRAEFDQALTRFLDALESGDEAALLASLAPEAVLYGDGGGKASAVINPLDGADRIVRFLLGLRRKYPGAFAYERADVNGVPGTLVHRDGAMNAIASYEVINGQIARIFYVVNPDKITPRTP